MVFSRELPHSFADALRVSREILSSNRELVRKDLVETEAEQLVIGAHRIATGEKLSRAGFFAILGDRLPEATGEKLLVLAGRRAEGVPLQHILGWQVFLEHEYQVSPSVLVPRPETEVLVREALKCLKSPALGFEVGLGSGIISIELLHAFPGLRMIATELSDQAIVVAGKNAATVLGSAHAARLEIRRPAGPTEVLEPFSGEKGDFLISNPPYLDAGTPFETDAEVLAHEPRVALFPLSGDPLEFYRKIVAVGAELLKPGGQIFLEIAAERVEPTLALFAEGWDARVVPDLAGRPRVIVAERKSSHG